MNEKTLTKREYINRIMTYAHDEDKPYLQHELELLDKKNSAERKPTANQIANDGFKGDIVAYMEPDVKYTVADLTKQVPSLVAAGISANRVTSLMTQLVKAGAVVRTEEKRKGYYSLA